MGLKLIQTEQEAARERFIRDNYQSWKEDGQRLKEWRESLGLSLRDAAGRVGTSHTRMSKLEKGLPIQQADHTRKSCEILYELIEIKQDVRKFYSSRYWR